MFEVESSQGDVISPVKRRLRSATKGVKRTVAASLSPVKDSLSMPPVKRQRVGDPRNSSRKNVETLGEEQLVERRAWKRHPMSQVKETLSVSPVKRRKVGNPRIPSRQNVETLGEEQLVERRAWKRHPMTQVKETLSVSPVKRRKVGYPRIPSRQNVETLGEEQLVQRRARRKSSQPAATSKANVCYSCRHRFPSYEALEYHQNLKIRALKKCKIATSRFSPDLHLAICPIRTCCSTFAEVETMREHLLLRHRQAGKQYLNGLTKTLDQVYVILKHSPSEKGIISCPACQTSFMSKSSLLRHQTNTCRGYGQYNCVICAGHFRDRKKMMNHMKTAHPAPPGARITGMFQGKQKVRKGVRSKRSIGGREILSQFTFVPDHPIVTTAGEFFTSATTEGMTWLIQRARSSGGNTIIRLNVSSLVRRGDSTNLISFETQARLIHFPASESPKSIVNRFVQLYL